MAEKRSGLERKVKRRWSGITGGYDVELWLIGVLLLRETRISEPNYLSEGWRGYPSRGVRG